MKKFLIFLMVTVFILAGLSFVGYVYYESIGAKPLDTNEEVIEITVDPNDTFSKVLTKLDNEGLLKNLLVTRIFYRFNPTEVALKPGTFRVQAGGSLHDIIKELNEGEDLYQVTVLIPEGFTIERMGDTFEEMGMFSKEAFIHAVESYVVPSWLEDLDDRHYALEGFLAPATYQFRRGQSPSYVVDTMYRAFVNRMYEVFGEIGEEVPTSKWNEIITIAAMIEREAANVAEMPTISSVIYNRLIIGQRLQIDATVVYALGLWSKELVTYEDLEINSPYNTYRVPALPLGPIANPGKAAILAALKPATTEYYYYVLNPAAGEHYFTDNYDDFLEKKSAFQGD